MVILMTNKACSNYLWRLIPKVSWLLFVQSTPWSACSRFWILAHFWPQQAFLTTSNVLKLQWFLFWIPLRLSMHFQLWALWKESFITNLDSIFLCVYRCSYQSSMGWKLSHIMRVLKYGGLKSIDMPWLLSSFANCFIQTHFSLEMQL